MRCPGGEIGRHKGFKIPRLSSRAGSSPARGTIKFATLAQLVERNLAKVEVTSSNLVCRSKKGALAEWPCSGLQIRGPRFDSGRRLHFSFLYFSIRTVFNNVSANAVLMYCLNYLLKSNKARRKRA